MLWLISTDKETQFNITSDWSAPPKVDNKKKIEKLKEIFIELYIENLRDGMDPKDALEKAKFMIFCFLFVQP